MRRSISSQLIAALVLFIVAVMAGCQATTDNANTTATTSATPPGAQQLTQVPRPQKIERCFAGAAGFAKNFQVGHGLAQIDLTIELSPIGAGARRQWLIIEGAPFVTWQVIDAAA